MPPFFFNHWMKMIKSQPSKWKGKKNNFKPGTSPSRSLPHLSSFSPFPPLICSLPVHSWLCGSHLCFLSVFPFFSPLILHSWVKTTGSHLCFLSLFPFFSPLILHSWVKTTVGSHLCFLSLFPFFSPLILHSWVKTTVGFNQANLFEADVPDLIKDVSTARWRPPSPSTGIKDVFTGGWRPPSPSTGPTSSKPTSLTSSKKSPSRTASLGLWARPVPRSES